MCFWLHTMSSVIRVWTLLDWKGKVSSWSFLVQALQVGDVFLQTLEKWFSVDPAEKTDWLSGVVLWFLCHLDLRRLKDVKSNDRHCLHRGCITFANLIFKNKIQNCYCEWEMRMSHHLTTDKYFPLNCFSSLRRWYVGVFWFVKYSEKIWWSL